jgi:hypothetical protein
LVGDLERSFVQPNLNLLTSQAIFAEEAPIVEVSIAKFVETAGKLCGVQHAGEDLFGEGPSQPAT